jgi:enoyl-CoA hydratase
VPITRTVRDGIATLTMDDGKVNAFDFEFFDEFDARLDECAADAAVVIAGRPGMFSAGLNMKVMQTLDDEGTARLLVRFGESMLRAWLEPRPVVAAATGHAIAGGTIMAMVCDHAVAADGDFRWGLTETTIDFPLPRWIIAIARGNVRSDRLDDLLLPGASVIPAEAVEVGFADAVAPPDEVIEAATAKAGQLTQLPRLTYAETKRRLRQPAVEAVRETMHADLMELLSARRGQS